MLLESIENKLQMLLEGSLDRAFYPGLSRSLSSRMVSLIDDKIKTEQPTDHKLPALIDIHVSPEKWEAWLSTRAVLDEVAQALEALWAEQGYHFECHPKIRLFVNAELVANQIEILTNYARQEQKQAQTALQETPRTVSSEAIPASAYFIIDGKEQFSLDKELIKIGRRSSCDLILRDPLVSRDHIQLRAEGGRYLLFDLSSTGGTFVNNIAVKSATLKPGDVIRLGKTILIYNQDLPGALTQTRILPAEAL